MNAAELKRAKKQVRRAVRAARDAIAPEERERLSARIVDRFLSLPEVGSASALMVYWSFGSEVDTSALIARLRDRGVTTALPRIHGDELEVRTYTPGDPVSFAPFGAAEPTGGTALDPLDLDVVLTPGVAFDRTGARIGYGGGFYDRFLGRARPDVLRASVAFAMQVVDEPVPTGSFDLTVDVIVTENDTIHCDRART